MRTAIKRTAAAAALCFAALSAQARADTLYNWQFIGGGLVPAFYTFNITGQLTASDAFDRGGHDITSITGTVDYCGATATCAYNFIVPITAMVPNPTPGFPSTDSTSGYTFDNLLFYPGSPGNNLDQFGMLFTAAGKSYRIFGGAVPDPVIVVVLTSVDPMNTNAIPFIDPTFPIVGEFTISAATPIPAALSLFASGLGVLGFGAYRRKWKQIAA